MALPRDFARLSKAEKQRWIDLTGVRGTFGPWTVCRDGWLRKRRCSDMAGYQNDASREPNRVNGTDFGYTSSVGKALRRALPDLLRPYGTPKLRGYLTGALRRLVDQDVARPRGQRRLTVSHFATLKGFSFNPAAPLPASLRAGCSLTRALPDGTLALSLPALPPAPTYGVPARATHYGLSVGFALLDPTTGTARAVELTGIPSPCPLNAPVPLAPPPTHCLTLGIAPTATELAIIVIGLCYYELRAGQLVPLPTPTAPLTVSYAGPAPARSSAAKRARQGLRSTQRHQQRQQRQPLSQLVTRSVLVRLVSHLFQLSPPPTLTGRPRRGYPPVAIPPPRGPTPKGLPFDSRSPESYTCSPFVRLLFGSSSILTTHPILCPS